MLKKPFFFSAQDEYDDGKWVGTGPDYCTDPKRLRKAITDKPDEIFLDMIINTFLGKSFYFNDSFDSLWKPIDFVYDPVFFNRYDPIVSVCYELNVSKGLEMEGIQSIDIRLEDGGFVDFVKISPPGNLYQNADIRSRKIKPMFDVILELDYQIYNVLKVGDEYCHPDPSLDRDECVIEQLLHVRRNYVDVIGAFEQSTFFRIQSNSSDAYHLP